MYISSFLNGHSGRHQSGSQAVQSSISTEFVLFFPTQAISKCQHCQLCVLRENPTVCEVAVPRAAEHRVQSPLTSQTPSFGKMGQEKR